MALDLEVSGKRAQGIRPTTDRERSTSVGNTRALTFNRLGEDAEEGRGIAADDRVASQVIAPEGTEALWPEPVGYPRTDDLVEPRPYLGGGARCAAHADLEPVAPQMPGLQLVFVSP